MCGVLSSYLHVQGGNDFLVHLFLQCDKIGLFFANQSCFANFAVYIGIYNSLSLGRNGIEVCLNLLRVSD